MDKVTCYCNDCREARATGVVGYADAYGYRAVRTTRAVGSVEAEDCGAAEVVWAKGCPVAGVTGAMGSAEAENCRAAGGTGVVGSAEAEIFSASCPWRVSKATWRAWISARLLSFFSRIVDFRLRAADRGSHGSLVGFRDVSGCFQVHE